jgi:streptogramin lyase
MIAVYNPFLRNRELPVSPPVLLTILFVWFIACSAGAAAAELTIVDGSGAAVPTAMVTRSFVQPGRVDASDNGYPAVGTRNNARPEVTRFSDADGKVNFDDVGELVGYRVRKQQFQDRYQVGVAGDADLEIEIESETDPARIAASKPSNLWLTLLDFDGDRKAREHFLLHCGFCHQQASSFMRYERTSDQWLAVIDRMNRYGAQIAWEFREPLADYLHQRYRDLRDDHASVPDFEAWQGELADIEITEWQIGDAFSQMHDLLVHPNGLVYVGDNLMDRIYEVDPTSGDYQVYKVPREGGQQLGGILGNRFAVGYPKVENYWGVHSFAVSPRDGHIFITPSMQQGLLEFDPVSKEFRNWPMPEGFYPHTIRADRQDRIWFTLALSNEVAMFDRATEKFHYYKLPPRGLKERVIFWFVQRKLGKGEVSEPPKYDWNNNGFPMPYGIDIAPDGGVWVARLYADDIARIDPDSGSVELIKTPFDGPRRLRIDRHGNPWIVGFSSELIARYNVGKGTFDTWLLPVQSETPYSLNVDLQRDVVWVNGNQSDSLMAFDIATQNWRVIPLSRYRSFTRDVEIEADGSVFTSNSNFPSWQIEDGRPTLIRVRTIANTDE